jgi:hypothetical protein
MSSILTCPACQQAVSLPAGRLALLECPHCHSGIALQAQVAPLATNIEVQPPRQVAADPPRRQPAAAPASTVADYRQRQAKRDQRPSPLGQLVGIIAGGLLGTAMGYWLLNYFGGPRYDFLHVPLPLVAHTQPQQEPSPAEADKSASYEEEELPPTRSAAAPFSTPPADAPIAASPAPNASAEHAPQPMPGPTLETPSEPPRRSFEFPRYNSQDLEQSLAAVQATLGCPHCQSTGFVNDTESTGDSTASDKRPQRNAARRIACQFCGGKPSGRITADVFARLCQLSQVATFIDLPPDDPHLPAQRRALKEILLRAASDRDKQNAIGRLAGYHLAETSRATSGVLLAGTVEKIDRQGRLFTTRLVLFGLPEVVHVVSMARPPLKPTDKVLIAGSIVDQPRDNLAGYEGTLPQVVWGGLPVKLYDDPP